MMTDKNKDLYVQCSCGSEVLKLEFDKEIDSYYLAIFDCNGKRSWRNQLRQVWRTIKHGEPYSDRMILTSDDANKVVEFIDKLNREKNG